MIKQINMINDKMGSQNELSNSFRINLLLLNLIAHQKFCSKFFLQRSSNQFFSIFLLWCRKYFFTR